MNRLALLLVFAALVFALPARADSSYSAIATRIDERIRIDGKMDEQAWSRAQKLGDWHQTRIKIGAPAVEPTETRILYDRDNLYFGFHCFDSQPDKITAYSVQNESFLHQEDNVTVIIDTFLDHRNAYYFWTNALGVRTDGRIVDGGEAFSTDWRGEWEAKGSIVSDGWIVEIRIPFSNFQYNEGEEHTFGILLDREQARLQEWSNWTPDGVNSAKVERYPHLKGLKNIASRKIATVTGYVSSMVSASEGQKPVWTPNAGVDLQLTPTNWLSLKFTLNPDFSQVEIDQDVLWLNPEERALPERRPFFLEGADLYIAPINLYFSRRIAPRRDDQIFFGAQAVGKAKGVGFSMLDVQSREHRPNKRGMEDVNSSVVRMQKDIGKRSAISAMALGRIGDKSVGTFGTDLNLHIWDEIFMQAQAAKSFSPDAREGSEAYHVGVHRFDTVSEFWLQYEDIGKNFRSPLGFVPVLDKQSVYAHAYYNWFTKSAALPRIDMTYDDLWRVNQAGQETRHLRKLSLQPYLGHDFAFYLEGKLDKTGGYDSRLGTLGFVVFPNDWQSLTLTSLYGTFLGGNMMGLNGQLNLKFGQRLVLKMSGFYTTSWGLPASSPLWGTDDAGYQWAFYGQLRYQLNPDFYARLTFQQGDAIGIADLNAVSGRVIDAVIAWHYRIGSDAFLVYTQQPFDGAQDHRLLGKVSFTY